MMISGRFDTLSPPNASTLMTLSTVNRSTDCALAVVATSTRSTAPTSAGRASCLSRPLSVDNGPIGCGDRARQRFRERVDDVGMEFGAGASPQFLQRLG